ncbi:MAG: hypothetical protein DSY80_05395, partial [Desulfocapsa sp.]
EVTLSEKLEWCAVQVDLGRILGYQFNADHLIPEDVPRAITMLDDLQAKIEKMKTELIDAR